MPIVEPPDRVEQARLSARGSRAMARKLSLWAKKVPNGAALGLWAGDKITVKLFASFRAAVEYRETLPEAQRGSSPILPLQKKISLCISRPPTVRD